MTDSLAFLSRVNATHYIVSVIGPSGGVMNLFTSSLSSQIATPIIVYDTGSSLVRELDAIGVDNSFTMFTLAGTFDASQQLIAIVFPPSMGAESVRYLSTCRVSGMTFSHVDVKHVVKLSLSTDIHTVAVTFVHGDGSTDYLMSTGASDIDCYEVFSFFDSCVDRNRGGSEFSVLLQ